MKIMISFGMFIVMIFNLICLTIFNKDTSSLSIELFSQIKELGNFNKKENKNVYWNNNKKIDEETNEDIDNDEEEKDNKTNDDIIDDIDSFDQMMEKEINLEDSALEKVKLSSIDDVMSDFAAHEKEIINGKVMFYIETIKITSAVELALFSNEYLELKQNGKNFQFEKMANVSEGNLIGYQYYLAMAPTVYKLKNDVKMTSEQATSMLKGLQGDHDANFIRMYTNDIRIILDAENTKFREDKDYYLMRIFNLDDKYAVALILMSDER